MKVYFRTDASTHIGSGHVMRCLTLADILKEQRAETSFICRELPGNLCDHIESKGYKVFHLPYEKNGHVPDGNSTPYSRWFGVDGKTDAEQTNDILNVGDQTDWLIIDHYSIDNRWESKIRSYTSKIMVIDDLANRKHDCDLLLDQNLYEGMECRYDGLVPEDCITLVGPKYALLRREFADARKKMKGRDGTVKRILISFGGSDRTNETAKTLEAIGILNMPNVAVDVVVGSANPHKEEIEELCSTLTSTYYHSQVSNMAELMVNADLAIGAGGSTTWERCSLSLPSIVVAVAENQITIAEAVDKAGAALYLGKNDQVSEADLCLSIKEILEHPERNEKMAHCAGALVEGDGAHLTAVKMG